MHARSAAAIALPTSDDRAREETADARRVYQRTDLQVDVTFEGEHNFFNGFSENISEGGLFVATHSLCEVGTRLPLVFTLPGDAEPIRVTAEVRWVRLYNEASDAPPGMGLSFVGLSERDWARISRFVQQRAPIFWDV